jgi:serine/threonine protein kinase
MAYHIPGFQLDHIIGRGSMATVYAATDLTTGAECAVKIPDPTFARDTRSLGAFVREARRVMDLGPHPNIVAVHFIGQGHDDSPQSPYHNSQVPYILMERARGEALDQLIRRRGGRFPLNAIAHIGVQVCAALAHAHESSLRLVHRDIKPANILVDETTWRAQVADFGIAHAAEGTRPVGGSVFSGFGTWEYMAPEQFAAKASAASDLYAVGCVLYELATGRQAFVPPSQEHATYEWYRAHHARGFPVPPADLNGLLPAGFEDVILRLLAKRPDARFASARATQHQLQKLIEDLPTAERVTTFRSLPCAVCASPAATTESRLCPTCGGWQVTPPVDVILRTEPGALVELKTAGGDHLSTNTADGRGIVHLRGLHLRQKYLAVATRVGFHERRGEFVAGRPPQINLQLRPKREANGLGPVSPPVRDTIREQRSRRLVMVGAATAILLVIAVVVAPKTAGKVPGGGRGSSSAGSASEHVALPARAADRDQTSGQQAPPVESPADPTLTFDANVAGARIAVWTGGPVMPGKYAVLQAPGDSGSVGVGLRELNNRLTDASLPALTEGGTLYVMAYADGWRMDGPVQWTAPEGSDLRHHTVALKMVEPPQAEMVERPKTRPAPRTKVRKRGGGGGSAGDSAAASGGGDDRPMSREEPTPPERRRPPSTPRRLDPTPPA